MEHSDDDFARRLRILTKLLMIKLDEQLSESEKQNRIFGLDEYRRELAESHPETA
jgi:hypothetical protein